MNGVTKINKQPRAGWTRGPELLDVTSRLGEKLREIRAERGLSLKEANDLTGVPSATLSRIENNKMAPTLGLLSKIVEGLRLSWDDILPQPAGAASRQLAEISFATGKPSILRSGDIDYEPLHRDSPLAPKVGTLIMSVKQRTVAEAGGLVGHPRKEFCYVIDGDLTLHFKGRRARTLKPGESALFDASTPHAYTSKTGETVRVLLVTIP
jgi:transcriptional regulator with XRE-family HTH domain